MKLVITAVALCLAVSAPAFAKTQQEKMKTCNAEAKTRTLKGDERRTYYRITPQGRKTAQAEAQLLAAVVRELLAT